jgi:hypothetical protein
MTCGSYETPNATFYFPGLAFPQQRLKSGVPWQIGGDGCNNGVGEYGHNGYYCGNDSF